MDALKMKSNNHKLQYKNGILMILFFTLFMLLLQGCGTTGDKNQPSEDEGINKNMPPTSNENLKKYEPLPVLSDVVYDFSNYESVLSTDTNEFNEIRAVKGIYVSGHAAGIGTWMDDLVHLADTTEINAFVIDVKNDSGHITYDMDLEAVKEVGADTKAIRDMEGLMERLYNHDIYPIARIVAFKDPFLAERKPEYAIKNKDGSLWKYKNTPWLDPYNKDAWKYIVDVSKEAAKIGFKEIQFDYIRFEATSSLSEADFQGKDTLQTREEVILEFLEYAMEELKPYGVKVSADVFGTVITSSKDAATIGQDYVEMSKVVDVICPMIYPSHYGFGFYNTPKGEHSDLYPYRIIHGSMMDSADKLSTIPDGEHKAIVRPWLQAFTASYLGRGNYKTYDAAAIREQIQATYDAGLEEWILWHAGVKYNPEGLLPIGQDE